MVCWRGDVTPRPRWPVGGDLACKYSRRSAPEGPLEHETAFDAAGTSVEANWVTAELSQCCKTVARVKGEAGGRGSFSEVTSSACRGDGTPQTPSDLYDGPSGWKPGR